LLSLSIISVKAAVVSKQGPSTAEKVCSCWSLHKPWS